jgi:hypothetical protein
MLFWQGAQAGGGYYAGFLVEKSLSVDNVFVWAVIFSFFSVPREYQFRVLFWGIFGALVLRAVFTFAGVSLIERFEWILCVFGAFLLYTGRQDRPPRRNPSGRLQQQHRDATRSSLRPDHRGIRRAEMHLPTYISLSVIAIVLTVSVVASIRADRRDPVGQEIPPN